MTLRCDQLGYTYSTGKRAALRDVSIAFDAPVTAIIGPNGAGKSTLLRLLAGVADSRGQAGKIELDGWALNEIPVADRVRRMAYVSQTPRVAAPLTVAEVVGLGRAVQVPDRDAVRRALASVGLVDRFNDRFEHLSIGQRQLAAFARILAQFDGPATDRTRYLLADEPVAALDPRHAIVIADQIRKASGRGIRSVLVVHDVGFAGAVADRVVCLGRGGTVQAQGPPSEVLKQDVLEELFGCRFGDSAAAHPRPLYGEAASGSLGAC
ncbi:MAG: ABC transporter ATP-binding protein [Phycisphaerales bacterium]